MRRVNSPEKLELGRHLSDEQLDRCDTGPTHQRVVEAVVKFVVILKKIVPLKWGALYTGGFVFCLEPQHRHFLPPHLPTRTLTNANSNGPTTTRSVTAQSL